jgi:phosphoribosyl 1,2-cyclic phosphodiesterase
MRVTLWGTRGSLPAAGPETVRYGGNTSCVEVRGSDGTVLILDAGSGIRRLGTTHRPAGSRFHVLLTHLHMDHIQGLGFFQPLYDAAAEVHVWGPASTTLDLQERLARYLSPPLFPVRLRDLPCQLTLHDVPLGSFRVGDLEVTADLVSHQGPTLGYRIVEGTTSVAYLPDHDPALGSDCISADPRWLSGHELALGVNLLIHDAQYSEPEYADHVGWGHSSVIHAVKFAEAAQVQRLVTFHHDPWHDDAALDELLVEARESSNGGFELVAGTEGATFELTET